MLSDYPLWLKTIALALVCYSFYNLAAKLAVGRISPELLLIINGALLIGLGSARLFQSTSPDVFTISLVGVGIALMFGLGNGLGDYLYTTSFNQGAPLSLAAPIIFVGLNVVLALQGLLFFGEALNAAKVLGLVLSSLGIVFLSRG